MNSAVSHAPIKVFFTLSCLDAVLMGGDSTPPPINNLNQLPSDTITRKLSIYLSAPLVTITHLNLTMRYLSSTQDEYCSFFTDSVHLLVILLSFVHAGTLEIQSCKQDRSVCAQGLVDGAE